MTEPFSHADEQRVAVLVSAHPSKAPVGAAVLGAIAPPPRDAYSDAPTLDRRNRGEIDRSDGEGATELAPGTSGSVAALSVRSETTDSAEENEPGERDARATDLATGAQGETDEDARVAERASRERDEGNTELGNVFELVERGPATPLERALVSGFAVAGYGAQTTRDAVWFVRSAERLARDSNLGFLGFVDDLLEADVAADVWTQLALRVIEDGDRYPTVRARNAGRLAWLVASNAPSAQDAVRRVASDASDPWVQELAHRALRSASSSEIRLRGHVATSRTDGWQIVRWLTGIALIAWVARGLLALVGTQDRGELRLVPGGLRFRRATALLGRVVRERDLTFTIGALASVEREVRYPMIHTLVGLLGLAIGLVLGGVFLVDGVRSGETVLLLVAGVAIALGVGLDLGLEVLIPGRKGLVRMDITILPRRVIRLERVPVEEADRFIEAIRDRLGG